jgi:hypothetical protein
MKILEKNISLEDNWKLIHTAGSVLPKVFQDLIKLQPKKGSTIALFWPWTAALGGAIRFKRELLNGLDEISLVINPWIY